MSSAQRLAASKRVAQLSRYLVANFIVVLNALRHQRGAHCCHSVAQHDAAEVLNALRHQRGAHLLRIRPQISTRPGAQRLAASKRGAHPFTAADETKLDGCSTPCGIKERRTKYILFKPKHRLRVLNALRHQRGAHLWVAPPVAQSGLVLNALRHQKGAHFVGASLPSTAT